MAQSGGPAQAAQTAPSSVNNSRPGASVNAPLTNGGLLAAPVSMPASNFANGSSHIQVTGGDSVATSRVEADEAAPGGMPSVGNDPDGAKKRNKSFGITTVVVDSRRTSNDPMDDGSGEDDIEDSKTEDLSDGKEVVVNTSLPTTATAIATAPAADTPQATPVQPATVPLKKPEVAVELTAAAPLAATVPAAIPANIPANTTSAPPKRKTSTASNAGTNQARLQFTMGYTFNIFVYNTNAKSGAGSNSDALRPPSAKVQASAASAYVSDIEVDDEEAQPTPLLPLPPPAEEVVNKKTDSKKSKTKGGKTYAAATAGSGTAVSDAQLLAMFMQNESPKHGPQDRFKFVKIQTAPTKVVSRWTLVDYGNRSGPLAPPPQPFPTNTSPAMSMTKLKAVAAAAATVAPTPPVPAVPVAPAPTRAASMAPAEAPTELPIQPQSVSGLLPPTPHPSLVSAAVASAAAATQPAVIQQQPLVVAAGTYVPKESEITGATLPPTPQQASQIRGVAAVSAAAPNINSSLQQQPQPAASTLILSPIAPVTSAQTAVYTNESQKLSSSSSQSQYIHPEGATAAAIAAPSQTSYIPPVTQSQQQQHQQHGSQLHSRAEAEDHLRLVQTQASQPRQLQPAASASSPYHHHHQQPERPADPASKQQLAAANSTQPLSGHSISTANRSPSLSGEMTAATITAAKIDDSLRQQQLVLEQLLSGGPAMSGNVGREAVASAAAALPSQPPIVGEEMVRRLQEISTQQAGSTPGADQDPESASGTNQGAIDNRIERAMDLVKSHLMNAVRSEVEELKDKIKIMEATICNLQAENDVLKRNVPGEVLLQLQSTSLPALAAPAAEAVAPAPPAPSASTAPLPPSGSSSLVTPFTTGTESTSSGCSSVPVNPPPITSKAPAVVMAAPTPRMPAAAGVVVPQQPQPPAAAAPTPPPDSAAVSHVQQHQQQQ